MLHDGVLVNRRVRSPKDLAIPRCAGAVLQRMLKNTMVRCSRIVVLCPESRRVSHLAVRVAVTTLALACLGTFTGAALATPDYIAASPDEINAAYGVEVGSRAFSDELTASRTALINASVAEDSGCGARPDFKLSDVYPYKSGPDDVMWIERYDVDCKQPLRRSLLAFLRDDKVELIPLLPGTTAADPSLQFDASTVVTTAALTRTTKPCEQAAITDTDVTEPPPAGGGAWKERWTVLTCEETQEIDVNFTPSPSGGTDISVLATK